MGFFVLNFFKSEGLFGEKNISSAGTATKRSGLKEIQSHILIVIYKERNVKMFFYSLKSW